MDDEIYNMKLHDTATFGAFVVTKVPGGWIYQNKLNLIFVPFNDDRPKQYVEPRISQL